MRFAIKDAYDMKSFPVEAPGYDIVKAYFKDVLMPLYAHRQMEASGALSLEQITEEIGYIIYATLREDVEDLLASTVENVTEHWSVVELLVIVNNERAITWFIPHNLYNEIKKEIK